MSNRIISRNRAVKMRYDQLDEMYGGERGREEEVKVKRQANECT